MSSNVIKKKVLIYQKAVPKSHFWHRLHTSQHKREKCPEDLTEGKELTDGHHFSAVFRFTFEGERERSLNIRVLSLNDRHWLTECLANTSCPTRGASVGSSSPNTAAALEESTEFPEERKELNEEHTTLVTCVSLAAHLPLWLIQDVVEKRRWFVIYNAGDSLHLFPFPPPPRASLHIFTFPDEEIRAKMLQTDWCNISIPRNDSILAPYTMPFCSPAPISTSNCLCTIKLSGYHFTSFRLTLQSESWHYHKRLQNSFPSYNTTS